MNICPDIEPSVNPCRYYQNGGFCNQPKYFRCIEYVARNEPPLSYSSMQDWAACKRRYWYSTICGIQMIDPPVRMFMGKIMSDILDMIHGHQAEILPLKYIEELQQRHAVQEDEGIEIAKELLTLEGFIKAYLELPQSQLKGTPQAEFHWNEEGYPKVHGYLDLCLDELWAYEFKYTTNPDSYSKHTIKSQVSTYFIGLPELTKITLRILRVPALRQGKKESPKDFVERTRADVLTRPKHYIVDTAYYRNEFNHEETKQKTKWIAQEIHEAIQRGEYGCYQNEHACFSSNPCQYLAACTAGVVSETIYQKREKRSEL